MSNILGGKNGRFAYAPLSEDEQQVLHDLVDNDSLMIEIVDYGTVNKFSNKPIVGDAVLSMDFNVVFERPEFYMPAFWLELVLKTRSGIEIFREKMTTGAEPLYIRVGESFAMNWVIQFKHLDPKLVKTLKKGAIGLTNRYAGDWKLNADQMRMMNLIEQGQRNLKKKSSEDLKLSESKQNAQHDKIKDVNSNRIFIAATPKK